MSVLRIKPTLKPILDRLKEPPIALCTELASQSYIIEKTFHLLFINDDNSIMTIMLAVLVMILCNIHSVLGFFFGFPYMKMRFYYYS